MLKHQTLCLVAERHYDCSRAFMVFEKIMQPLFLVAAATV